MKTAFTIRQLEDPGIAEADRILQDCVHYGFCVSVCPTYVLTRDENESPRGRIDLIKEMLESDQPPRPATVRHIDGCLSCLSCMSTCAASVDYAHLVDTARSHIEEHYRRPLADRLMRGLVAAVIPRPALMRLALRAARLAGPIAPLLPGRLRGMVELAPARRAAAPAIPTGRLLPAEGQARRRVALIPGCAQQALAPHLNEASIRLLRRHGCDVVVPAMSCCGALTLHMGKTGPARRAAAQTLSTLGRLQREFDLDAIIVNASGCGTTMKDYAHLMAGEPQADEAAAIGGRVRDITEVLLDLGLNPPVRRTGLRVAYHDACSLQHGQKVVQPPRQLLRQAGFEVLDIPERHFCCGSAGTYNMLQPDTAAELGRRKAGHIASTGAHVACAGNLGCLEQLQRHASLPLLHTVELLDWATGGPVPASLETLGAIPPAAAPEATEANMATADEDTLW
ncbi:glycolate oxidase subunit GlcF [Pigmentiphaga sp. GD03639]|uniref:glycolate oxidase subunit GlcF n=1 Tax=unclassified Pigmentiphaga TaxID=2626614 RepID=UPI000B415B84|nr:MULTISPECIES: glycolate oxidase subunit GlcF [unclassified Pigmentiphaga]MDH2238571.1 glycolate oxidase subunit GlcF [Pigmentiphaga sp. GD03639]OVZ60203.1 glycolate oxidase iron-sulfur subunit [Pigmentiphaga sp. NML030171]